MRKLTNNWKEELERKNDLHYQSSKFEAQHWKRDSNLQNPENGNSSEPNQFKFIEGKKKKKFKKNLQTLFPTKFEISY